MILDTCGLQFRVPFVITSYNEIESDEDQDAIISGMGYPEACWEAPGWDIEENPNPASTTRAPCEGAAQNNDKVLPQREQWWWQCVMPPRA